MDVTHVRDLSPNVSNLDEDDLNKLKSDNEKARNWPRSPFPVRKDINEKVVLYEGQLSLIRADTLVNPTNESLTQLDLIDDLAGQDLEAYIKKKVRLCATGDVRLTPGFNSNFEHIIHAVPPKYQTKYKTAAETALFHTYFRILETMIEHKMRTVVMPTLATVKCNLPFEDNFHMQLRVIRRILEKKPYDFDKIVILVRNGSRFNAKPFFCYFPRTKLDEEIACYMLSISIGGPNGEPVIPEREIRIKSKPSSRFADQSIDLASGLDLSTVVGKTAFSRMRDDFDKQRASLRRNTGEGTSASSPNQLALSRSVFRGCTLL